MRKYLGTFQLMSPQGRLWCEAVRASTESLYGLLGDKVKQGWKVAERHCVGKGRTKGTRLGLEGQMGALGHGTSKSGRVLVGLERKGTCDRGFGAESVALN
jgi:hypothetical protein